MLAGNHFVFFLPFTLPLPRSLKCHETQYKEKDHFMVLNEVKDRMQEVALDYILTLCFLLLKVTLYHQV